MWISHWTFHGCFRSISLYVTWEINIFLIFIVHKNLDRVNGLRNHRESEAPDVFLTRLSALLCYLFYGRKIKSSHAFGFLHSTDWISLVKCAFYRLNEPIQLSVVTYWSTHTRTGNQICDHIQQELKRNLVILFDNITEFLTQTSNKQYTYIHVSIISLFRHNFLR